MSAWDDPRLQLEAAAAIAADEVEGEGQAATASAHALIGIGSVLMSIHDQLRDLTFAVNALAGQK